MAETRGDGGCGDSDALHPKASKLMGETSGLHPKAFDARKAKILSAIDKSPKGSFDRPIVPLLDLINASSDYATTSSCSGRVAVFRLTATASSRAD